MIIVLRFTGSKTPWIPVQATSELFVVHTNLFCSRELVGLKSIHGATSGWSLPSDAANSARLESIICHVQWLWAMFHHIK